MLDDYDVTDAEVADGTYEAQVDDASNIAMNLVAGAAPLRPPKDWMSDPKLDGPTPLTITSDGRVYGHIATWDTEHIGLPNGTRPPRSASGYKFFRTGVLTTEDGDDVPVGQLTLAGGHAPLRADAAAAVKHYDDTASAVADVTAGEDMHGIWVAGALRPGVSDEEIRALRASAPSGDWRVINGRLELVAVCQVNVPGFPVARAMVASGEITSLVAVGAAHMYELRQEETALSSMNRLEERLRLVETLLASGDAEEDEDEDEVDTEEDADVEDDEDKADEEDEEDELTEITASARQELVDRAKLVQLRMRARDTADNIVAGLTADGRYVRTPEGAARYGQPIGTKIVRDPILRAKMGLPEIPSAPKGRDAQRKAQLRSLADRYGRGEDIDAAEAMGVSKADIAEAKKMSTRDVGDTKTKVAKAKLEARKTETKSGSTSSTKTALDIASEGGTRTEVMAQLRKDNPDWSSAEISVVAGRMITNAKNGTLKPPTSKPDTKPQDLEEAGVRVKGPTPSEYLEALVEGRITDGRGNVKKPTAEQLREYNATTTDDPQASKKARSQSEIVGDLIDTLEELGRGDDAQDVRDRVADEGEIDNKGLADSLAGDLHKFPFNTPEREALESAMDELKGVVPTKFNGKAIRSVKEKRESVPGADGRKLRAGDDVVFDDGEKGKVAVVGEGYDFPNAVWLEDGEGGAAGPYDASELQLARDVTDADAADIDAKKKQDEANKQAEAEWEAKMEADRKAKLDAIPDTGRSRKDLEDFRYYSNKQRKSETTAAEMKTLSDEGVAEELASAESTLQSLRNSSDGAYTAREYNKKYAAAERVAKRARAELARRKTSPSAKKTPSKTASPSTVKPRKVSQKTLDKLSGLTAGDLEDMIADHKEKMGKSTSPKMKAWRQAQIDAAQQALDAKSITVPGPTDGVSTEPESTKSAMKRPGKRHTRPMAILPTGSRMSSAHPDRNSLWDTDSVGYIVVNQRTGSKKIYLSAGELDLELDDTFPANHDQTGANIGDYKVLGIIFGDTDKKPRGEFTSDTKSLPVSVFK